MKNVEQWGRWQLARMCGGGRGWLRMSIVLPGFALIELFYRRLRVRIKCCSHLPSLVYLPFGVKQEKGIYFAFFCGEGLLRRWAGGIIQ